jgi:hypothetical protein
MLQSLKCVFFLPKTADLDNVSGVVILGVDLGDEGKGVVVGDSIKVVLDCDSNKYENVICVVL